MNFVHEFRTKFVIFDKLGKISYEFARIREGYVTNGLYCILFFVGEITLKPKKWNTSHSIVMQFAKQNRVTDCLKCFLKISYKNATSIITIINGIPKILSHADQSMCCGMLASKAKLQGV